MNTVCILLVVIVFFLVLAYMEERTDRVYCQREMLRHREMWDRSTWNKEDRINH